MTDHILMLVLVLNNRRFISVSTLPHIITISFLLGQLSSIFTATGKEKPRQLSSQFHLHFTFSCILFLSITPSCQIIEKKISHASIEITNPHLASSIPSFETFQRNEKWKYSIHLGFTVAPSFLPLHFYQLNSILLSP